MELFNLKDKSEQVNFATAVKRGIGSDQGLFFPDEIKPLDNIDNLLEMPLVERSQVILRHLIGDEVPELESIIADAFTFTVRRWLLKISERALWLEYCQPCAVISI